MAGQRYRFALGLVFGSVAPVAISIMVVWTLLGIEPGGFGAGLVLGCAFLAILAPYVVGWVRSYVGLVGGAAVLLLINDALAGAPALLACAGAAIAVSGVVWFSLRFGHVWRPADARDQAAARSTLWPYPYA